MPNAIPRYARPILGREPLLTRVRQHLQTPGRVVTLVGPGGIGKSRIAAKIAADTGGIFLSGGSAGDEAGLGAQLAEALDRPGDAPASVLANLSGALIVLDHVHSVPDIDAVLARWLAVSPTTTWLLCNRRPLGLRAEVVVEVPALPVPTADELGESAAAGLLRNAAPVPVDLAENRDALVAVLRLTAGIPLAIELAASRLALLSLPELRERIDSRYFETLHRPNQLGQGLQAVLSDTWSQLDEGVQKTLAEISIFAGVFRVRDAEQVMTAELEGLDHLQVLREWHLLRSDDRWLSLAEPVRRFAEDKLVDEARERSSRRHAKWAASEAYAFAQQDYHLPGRWDLAAKQVPEFQAVLARAEAGEVDVEHAYCCALGAMQVLAYRGRASSVIELGARCQALPAPHTGPGIRSWVQVTVTHAQCLSGAGQGGSVALVQGVVDGPHELPTGLLAVAHSTLGACLHMEGRIDDAVRHLERSMTLAGTQNCWAWAASELALIAHDRGERAQAGSLLAGALERAEHCNDTHGQKRVLEILATIAVEAGDVAAAERWIPRFRDCALALGDRRKHALANLYWALLLDTRGECTEARSLYCEAREQLQRVGAKPLVAHADGLLGRLDLQDGDLERAAQRLPRWAEVWTATRTEAHTYGAVLAALQGDSAGARANAALAPDSALAGLAAEAAAILCSPLNEVFDPDAAATLVAAVDRVVNPVDRRLAQGLADGASARAAGWVISSDGALARAPSGERIDLARSRTNAAMLAALVRAHEQGLGLQDVTALVAAVWPDQRLIEKSARSRVYVALSNLRKAGLQSIILRDGGGWRLDPGAPLHVEPASN